jgi:hypothetical protein
MTVVSTPRRTPSRGIGVSNRDEVGELMFSDSKIDKTAQYRNQGVKTESAFVLCCASARQTSQGCSGCYVSEKIACRSKAKFSSGTPTKGFTPNVQKQGRIVSEGM